MVLRGVIIVHLLRGSLCGLPELGVSELGEEPDGTLLQVVGEIGPNVRADSVWRNPRRMRVHEVPLDRIRRGAGGGILPPP